MRLLYSTVFAALLAPFCVADADGQPDPQVEAPKLAPLIARANVFLSVGQFADAAKTYTEALELAPNDYLLYFKRATAYMSANRHGPALDDFDTVLRLTNGSFDGAMIAKAKVFAKEARWTEGKEALKEYSKKVPGDRVAGDLLFAISEGEVATKKAATAHKAGRWDACIEATTAALQTAVYSSELREQRADCALASGDLEQAVGDLIRLTHLGRPSTSLFMRIATLSYYIMEPSTQGFTTVKQCLHFDPDSKPCKAAHRQLKALDKLFTQLENAGEDTRQIIKLVTAEGTGLAAKFDAALADAIAALDPPLPPSINPKQTSARRITIYRAACRALIQNNEIRKGEKWCEELLRMSKDDMDGLVGAGEAAMKKEEWQEAVRFFDRAFEASGRSSNDIHGRLQKAHRLLKQASRKDYYKVLGVSRESDTKTIKKAYRKAAMSAHPDKGGSEQKMAAVNEAYEVLSNDELRNRFDNGDDPNDPTSQHGPGGGHPFQGSPFFFHQQQQQRGSHGNFQWSW